jgi:hypothetical protein
MPETTFFAEDRNDRVPGLFQIPKGPVGGLKSRERRVIRLGPGRKQPGQSPAGDQEEINT